jgi:hypothetical protein
VIGCAHTGSMPISWSAAELKKDAARCWHQSAAQHTKQTPDLRAEGAERCLIVKHSGYSPPVTIDPSPGKSWTPKLKVRSYHPNGRGAETTQRGTASNYSTEWVVRLTDTKSGGGSRNVERPDTNAPQK